MDSKKVRVLSLCFNHNKTIFACGTSQEFCVIKVEDGQIISKHKNLDLSNFYEGFQIVMPLFDLNKSLICLVGSGNNNAFPSNKVILWNDQKSKAVAEFRYKNDVKNVIFLPEKLIVVLENVTYLYEFKTSKVLDTLHTLPNKGLCVAGQNINNDLVIVLPYQKEGQILIKTYILNTNQDKKIQVLDTGIQMLGMDQQCNFIAVGNNTGTTIRIYSVDKGEFQKEFKRGSQICELSCLEFSYDLNFLLCASNRETIHIFKLNLIENRNEQNQNGEIYQRLESAEIKDNAEVYNNMENASPQNNQKGYLSSFFKAVQSKFQAIETAVKQYERSFAQIRLKTVDSESIEPRIKGPIACFSQNNSSKVIVVGANSTIFIYQFDPQQGGEAYLQQEIKWLDTNVQIEIKEPVEQEEFVNKSWIVL